MTNASFITQQKQFIVSNRKQHGISNFQCFQQTLFFKYAYVLDICCVKNTTIVNDFLI